MVIWVPFETSTPENNGLRVVPKSKEHVDVLLNGNHKDNIELVLYEMEKGLKLQEEGKSVGIHLNFGDALIFNKCVLHSNSANNTL